MSVSIRIQSLEDAKNGEPVIPGVTKENIESIDHLNFGILEKGTVGGQTTVMFGIRTADGKYVIAQATGREFEAMYSTFKGADERFNK